MLIIGFEVNQILEQNGHCARQLGGWQTPSASTVEPCIAAADEGGVLIAATVGNVDPYFGTLAIPVFRTTAAQRVPILGEPIAGVSHTNFHPIESRFFRLSLQASL